MSAAALDLLTDLDRALYENHEREHRWKAVPYYDCPLHPCFYRHDIQLILEGRVSGPEETE